MGIVIGILSLLFFFQRFGTKVVGFAFGPMMLLWFSMLRGLGLVHVANVPGRHAPNHGEINYLQIYKGLEQNGYHGWMAMEFLPVGDATTELRQAAAEIR